MRMLLYCHNVQLTAAAAILSYRPLISEHLVFMVLSYWRSSAELEDLFTHCTVTLGIVVQCVHATTLPDLQASALTSSDTMETRCLERGLYYTNHNVQLATAAVATVLPITMYTTRHSSSISSLISTPTGVL